ncbi:MAG: hypothetical protein DRZ79_01055 [Candidatus Cloacimonadota bacterium]|nr:MAG: hypothetical protein DRZ79_01055 [Candidatus Cloacimonadota bacterium]
MNWYINAVTQHPILTAIIQFAVLGTFGEIISKWIINKKVFMPFSFKIVLWKMAVWSILAVCIKYAFVGIKGYVSALTEHHLLPQAFAEKGIIRAFGISVLVNLQFGLFLVIFHRILDNLVLKEKNWKGLDKGMLSLLWFWIPAHTVTFSLPKEFQIGLAALWSVMLGVILGFFNRK